MSKQAITIIAAAAILYIIFGRKKCVSSSIKFDGIDTVGNNRINSDDFVAL